MKAILALGLLFACMTFADLAEAGSAMGQNWSSFHTPEGMTREEAKLGRVVVARVLASALGETLTLDPSRKLPEQLSERHEIALRKYFGGKFSGLLSLAEIDNSELLFQELLLIAARLTRDRAYAPAALILTTVQSADRTPRSILDRARHDLDVLRGGGTGGEKVELFLNELSASLTDPVNMIGLPGRASKLASAVVSARRARWTTRFMVPAMTDLGVRAGIEGLKGDAHPFETAVVSYGAARLAGVLPDDARLVTSKALVLAYRRAYGHSAPAVSVPQPRHPEARLGWPGTIDLTGHSLMNRTSSRGSLNVEPRSAGKFHWQSGLLDGELHTYLTGRPCSPSAPGGAPGQWRIPSGSDCGQTCVGAQVAAVLRARLLLSEQAPTTPVVIAHASFPRR